MPIWSGQSDGLGTSDGDQQYVKGILSASTRHGPSDLGMGSKSSESRQVLMRSPSLHSGPEGQHGQGQGSVQGCHAGNVWPHSPLPGHPLHRKI